MRYSIAFFLGLILQVPVFTQNINPGPDEVFRMDEVGTIALTMSAEDKEELIYGDHPEDRIYFLATVHFTNSLLDTIVDSIGVRNRGNTSIDNFKRPLKIDFKEFGGVKFFDHKKFNLKPDHNDPSLLREFLCLYILRESGVPAAMASFINVYINGEYMGIYLNVEQVDDEFLDRRFDNDTGNLYKCLYQDGPAELRDPENAYNNICYELKTNEEINDRTKLVEFIQILSHTGSESFPEELADHFRVDMFLRYLAVEALMGHWDSPTMLSNNYYLYEDALTNKIVLIPYDLDNTLGIDWLNRDWSEVSFEEWGLGNWQTNALSVAMTEVPEFYDRYYRYVVTVVDYVFNEAKLFPLLDITKNMIDEYVLADTYYPLDWGFTYNDFDIALVYAYGSWVNYAVKPFIIKRTGIAIDELGSVEGFGTLYPEDPFSEQELPVPFVKNTQERSLVYPNPCTEYFMIRSDKAEQVMLYSMDGKPVLSASLNNNRRISVTGLPKGLYILKIVTKDEGLFQEVLVIH